MLEKLYAQFNNVRLSNLERSGFTLEFNIYYADYLKVLTEQRVTKISLEGIELDRLLILEHVEGGVFLRSLTRTSCLYLPEHLIFYHPLSLSLLVLCCADKHYPMLDKL